jgi:hypothetical protein
MNPTQAAIASSQFYLGLQEDPDNGQALISGTPVAPGGMDTPQMVRKFLGANKGYGKYDRLAAGYGNDEGAATALGLPSGVSGTFYDPIVRAPEYDRGADEEAQFLGSGITDLTANILTDIPTSSTNYSRPRTVAAGYDEASETMTVVFRDGTFYNYYEVTPGEWEAFHASYSKGAPWLNRGFADGKQTADGIFINKPRGYADMTSIPPAVQEQLYRVARANQIVKQPKARKGRYAPGKVLASQPGLRKGRGGIYRSGWVGDINI